MSSADRIAHNLAEIRRQIAQAAANCGRAAEEITLIAVAKYVGEEETLALVQAGCREIGESRPQVLEKKRSALERTGRLPAGVRWHLIGHLQRNKVKRLLPQADLIHTVDSRRLLAEIEAAAAEQNRFVSALLEVNISGDAAKHGFSQNEMLNLMEELPQFPHLRIQGLMTMAGLEGGKDRARADFDSLRNLRDKLQENAPAGVHLHHLSMGMSGDFPQAIAAGATLVRIGSALFEGVE